MLHDECSLRRSAFEALSTLTSYVGYYHQIGRSDLIAETNPTRSVDVYERIMSSKNGVPPIYVRNAIKSIAEKVSALTNTCQNDLRSWHNSNLNVYHST